MNEIKNKQVIIYVDGQEIQAEAGAMLLDVIDSAGLGERVPRMCHHKELLPAGNCRVCVVEIDGMPNTVPSCHTPVTEGMKVFTSSEKVVSTRQAVIEFMLINHPLDCLVCDQGGNCELQDMVYQFGIDHSRFKEKKLDKQPEDISPLIAVNANRCIKCMRCVRFLDEISGERELGMINRGENCKIASFFDESVGSKLSGNTIDVCPVGALLPKSATHKIRPWELERTASVSPYDALGTNIYVNSFDNKVITITPKKNDAINGSWISDQDRFGFLENSAKTELPICCGGETPWEPVNECLAKLFAKDDSTLFMVSSSATVEQMLAVENLAAALPNAQVDYCSTYAEVGGYYRPYLPMDIEQLTQSDLIILAGVSLDKDLPVLGARLRKAGCQIVMVDPENPDAGLIKDSKKPVLLFGKGVSESNNATELRKKLATTFAHTNLQIGDVSGAANSAAAVVIKTLSSNQEVAKSYQKVVFIGADSSEIDASRLDLAKQADKVIALLSNRDEKLESIANMILPIPGLFEVSGSYVNMELKKQGFEAAIAASQSSRTIEEISIMIAKAANITVTEKITLAEFDSKLVELEKEVKA